MEFYQKNYMKTLNNEQIGNISWFHFGFYNKSHLRQWKIVWQNFIHVYCILHDNEHQIDCFAFDVMS